MGTLFGNRALSWMQDSYPMPTLPQWFHPAQCSSRYPFTHPQTLPVVNTKRNMQRVGPGKKQMHKQTQSTERKPTCRPVAAQVAARASPQSREKERLAANAHRGHIGSAFLTTVPHLTSSGFYVAQTGELGCRGPQHPAKGGLVN